MAEYGNVPPPADQQGGETGFSEAVRKAKEIAARLSGGPGAPPGPGEGPAGGDLTGNKRSRPGLGSDERDPKRTAGENLRHVIHPPDDPSFNYQGLLIGPRGSTLKAMESESGAKILIRGRGTKGDDGTEPLHVVLVANTQEKIDSATRLVENLIYNREGVRDSLKQQQLHTLADYNGRSAGAGAPAASAPATNIAPPGPQRDRRARGANTAPLANPRWVPPSDDNDNPSDNTTGGAPPPPPPAPVAAAPAGGEEGEKKPFLSDYGATATPLPPRAPDGAGVGSGANAAAAIPEGHTQSTLDIPNSCVGVVIGKRGDSIKNIQERSGCRVQIQRDQDRPQGVLTRVVTLTGTPDAVQRGLDIINEVVRDAMSRDPSRCLPGQAPPPPPAGGAQSHGGGGGGGGGGDRYAPGPGQKSVLVTVPSSMVGVLIGRAGTQIRAMQDASGARIQIARETRPGSDEREVTIIGNDQTIAAAQHQIQMKLNESAARSMGMSGAGATGYGQPPQPAGGHYSGANAYPQGQHGQHAQAHAYAAQGQAAAAGTQQSGVTAAQPDASAYAAYGQQAAAYGAHAGYDYSQQQQQQQQQQYAQQGAAYAQYYGQQASGYPQAGGETDWAAAAAAYAQQKAAAAPAAGAGADGATQASTGTEQAPPPPPPGQ